MNRNQKLILFSLVLAKLVLGFVFINRLSVDLDEPFSIFHAQQDLTVLNQIFVHENNPPLHFWLLHFWIKVFGIEPWAVRSLSLLFSFLTIPVLLKIGQGIKNTEVGLWLIALFVFSNFHHSFGIEARTYSLFSFLFSLNLLFLLKSVQAKNWFVTLSFGLTLSLLFYAHYIAIIVIPVLLAVFLLAGIRAHLKVNIYHTLFASSVLVLFSLQVILPFFSRLSQVSEKGTWVPRPQLSELYGFINKFMNGPGFALVFILVFSYILIRKKIQFKELFLQALKDKIGVVLSVSFAIYFGAFLLSRFASSSVFLDRYLFFLSLGFFAGLAWFVNYLSQKIGLWSWIFAAAVILGFNPLKTHDRESDKLADYVKQYQGSYLISPPFYDLTFLYHFDRELFKRGIEKAELYDFHIYPIYSIEDIGFENFKRPIVLIDAGAQFVFGEQKLKSQLDERLKLSTTRTFKGNYSVSVYE